jgi:hypothetical protein
MRSKCEVEEKQGGEGILTAEPSELSSFVAVDHGSGVGQPKSQSPFYSALAPDNLAGSTQIYLFTPTITSHNGKVSKGQNTSFTRMCVSVGRPWEFRSPFSPCKELVASSAHLEDRTALTDEGLLLGKMVFISILPRPAGLLVSSHARLWIYGGSFAIVI